MGQQEPVIWLRPEQAPVGRPAERSRAEITAAAVELADREGLDAVSMRRLAATLGTGAASLYRYVANRDDLLDLMIDSTAGEYHLPAPTGDWQADLLEIAHQARRIMRRHPWLPILVVTRPTLGPHGIDLLEHLFDVLADHPAEPAHKLEAFAVLNALTSLFVQNELAASDPGAQRQSSYLRHTATTGTHPRIAAMLAATQPEHTSHDRFATVLTRALTGVLG
ncbi:TetR/AcrR family transcriptional regulator [Streptomyces sp. NPDC051987]|uniref:TetR/AcrR family transcriptional regulator n=1 Tax=Streptomyces sp. NPDC051987 TaxID=3155808 RepID=UPI0034493E3F